MAIFKKTPKEKKEKGKEISKEPKEKAALDPRIFFRPHITEKSALLAEKGAYTFEIAPDANKKQVAAGIRKAYGFSPVKIRTAKATEKQTRRRGVKGMRRGNRKAIVYVKKGDKIDFM